MDFKTRLLVLKTCWRIFRLRTIGLTSSRVSIFFTVFTVGSKGGIFSTSENTLNSEGIISNPLGAFSEALTVPETATEECAFND